VASPYLASSLMSELGQPRPSVSHERLALIHHTLTVSAFASSTVSLYSSAVSRYLAYCASTTHRGRHTSIPALDACVQEYICTLYHVHCGKNRQLAVNTVYGLYMRLPSIAEQLRGSESLLRGWKRLRPSISYPPITWPLTVLVARTLAASGYRDCAIAVLVSFDGLLRVGELCAVKVADVSVLGDRRRGDAGALQPGNRASFGRLCIRLATTKTGSNQTAELYDHHVTQLLSRHIRNRHGEELVFAFPATDRANYFRTALHTACSALRIDAIGFTPHSLRHGGATHAHSHMGQSIEQVMHRGRWRSNDSCRTYIQSGTAALLTQQVPADVLRQAQDVMSDWFDCIWVDCFPQPQ
jgi:integrase